MNDIVLQRIQSQTPSTPRATKPIVAIIVSEPLSLEELRSLLMAELKVVPTPPPAPNELAFESIFDFVDWYLPHRLEFNEAQRVPLDTLIQTRDMIGQGCHCKRAEREQAAFQYFKLFWERNAQTDLIPTALKIAHANKVRFSNFLTLP